VPAAGSAARGPGLVAPDPLPLVLIRRTRGIGPQRKAQALELEPLARIVELIDTDTIAGLRDHALLLPGFAAALRRSELVALNVEDLGFDSSRGLVVTVRRSKTGQQGQGALVAVPYAREPTRCAVRSVGRYLDATGIGHGAVFRQMRRGDNLSERRLSDQSVALILKRRAEAAGVTATQLSGHSLRAGSQPPRRRPVSRSAQDRQRHAAPQPAGAARLHPRRHGV
jgi:site-specific recombinase XerD